MHAGSIRTISKTKIREQLGEREYIVVSAGSRMQANIYRVVIKDGDFEMGHICSFMKSSEQDEEQDFRIISSSVVHD